MPIALDSVPDKVLATIVRSEPFSAIQKIDLVRVKL